MESNGYYSFYRNIADDGTIRYFFETKSKIVYSVFFSPPDFSSYLDELPHLSKHGCLFGFFPVGSDLPEKPNQDPLVSNTVGHIIEDYFSTYGTDRILLFHCDNEDNRQGCRNRLFEIWYKKICGSRSFYKDGIEAELQRLDGTSSIEYLGFIAFKNNGNEQIIKAELNEVAVFLIQQK